MRHKILWVFANQKDGLISNKRPDLMIISKKKKKYIYIYIVDFTVSADH